MSRRYIILLLSLLLPLSAFSQSESEEFIHVPRMHFTSADSLPIFSTQVRVGADAPGVSYDALVEFPELVPLTRDEERAFRALGVRVGAMPEIEQYYGVSRKVGYLDVSFLPIVERDGRLYRIGSVKVSARPKVSAHPLAGVSQASATERYVSSSVLATGKWVKIRVSQEGVYQLTDARLREFGFQNPTRVKLYGYGGRILPQVLSFRGDDALIDDLEEVPLLRLSGSMLFFAEGTVRWSLKERRHTNNHYSRYSYYFLTEGDNPKALPTIPESSDAPSNIVTSVVGRGLYEEDAYGWYSGGTEMFDGYDFINGSQHAFRVLTPSAEGPANIDIAFSAASTSTTPTQVNVDLNGSRLGSFTVARFTSETESARETRKSFTAEQLTEQNNFTFNVTAGRSARLNFIRIHYPRTLNASDAPYAFMPEGEGGVLEICAKGASATTQLWRLGDAGQEFARVDSRLEDGMLRARIDNSLHCRYVIVDTSKEYPEPEKAADVANQNLHADANLDMVIVVPTSGKLLAQAQRLADAHTARGMRVRVVRAEQVYNEFSSGTPDATAIRRYMKMLYDRAATTAEAPRYLLLFGDGAWDNRMLSQEWSRENPDDYLLAYEVSQTESESNSVGTLYSYVTDDYYGLLDDDEGTNIVRDKIDLGIGRLPCHDEATAAVFVDKIICYLNNENVGAWKNRVIMMADNGDNNLHMNDCETVITTLKNATKDLFNLKKVYWDAYTIKTSATGNSFPQVTKILRQDMSEGALMFNYTGHGSPRQISHNKLLFTEDFTKPTGMRMPLWVFASCEITPFDSQSDDIGRAALQNPQGGAVAVICASRSVFANYNSSLNEVLCKNILGAGDEEGQYSMGDALRLSKVAMVRDGADRTMNKMKYVLLGDPSLCLSVPRGTVRLDSINGEAISAISDLRLSAGQEVRFSGVVVAEDGSEDGTFSGEITGTLFDREETVTCKNNLRGSNTPKVYKDRTSRLFEITDSVRAGKFSFRVLIPRDISYSTERGRLYLYAVNADHSLECHGFSDAFHLDGTAEQLADTIGPSIYVYLNTPDFPDGGVVGPDALFGATLADSAGINCSGISVGHDIELVIDDNSANPIVLNTYFNYDFGTYTSGTLAYPLADLAPGRHTLKLRAWDLRENSSTAALSLVVGGSAGEGLDISATQNPASHQTSFIVRLDDAGASRVAIEVYDTMGRCVWTTAVQDVQSSYYSTSWNLQANGGHPLGSGIYLYRARVDDARGSHTTKTKKLIIAK